MSLMPLNALSQCKTNPADNTPLLSLSAGFGIVDLINLGARYQLEQIQLGISLGTIPIKDENLFSASGDVYFHFAGSSDLSGRHPWYGRVGLNYIKDETEYSIDKFTYLSLRLGRDFNFSGRAGIEIDAGPCLLLDHEKKTKKTTLFDLGLEFPVIPTFGIVVFYRF